MPRIFIPLIAGAGDGLRASRADEAVLAILSAPWQQRKNPYREAVLMQAAQGKADEMAAQGYFSHTAPSGETPNEYVRRAGYRLPDWYAKQGNNVESIALGQRTVAEVIESWLASPAHRMHLAGEADFWRSQRALGVGHAVSLKGINYWVFVSAPPEE